MSTVPAKGVDRFCPQEIQESCPLEGWYVPRGHKMQVLLMFLKEPGGQSAVKRE